MNSAYCTASHNLVAHWQGRGSKTICCLLNCWPCHNRVAYWHDRDNFYRPLIFDFPFLNAKENVKGGLNTRIYQLSHQYHLFLHKGGLPLRHQWRMIITFATLRFLGRALRNDQNAPVRDLCHRHPPKTPYTYNIRD
jgi:hypothetical protein